MVPLQEHVRASIAGQSLFAPRELILVAVSGGVDSMVLLHVLRALSTENGWKLTVAHLNHQLRGRSSMADEQLVRRTAAEWEFPVVVQRANVRAFASRHKVSLEMAARKLRHDFLARAALQRNIRTIALAHHLDDQVELFFLRLFRGSGVSGLAGMKWSSPSPANPNIKLVRPLLDCPKSALIEFAREKKIRFREDSSNAWLDIRRNRIRHELLPLLESKYQPGIGRSIARSMEILAVESDFVNAGAECWVLENGIRTQTIAMDQTSSGADRQNATPRHKQVFRQLSQLRFDVLPLAVQRRCLQLQLLQLGLASEFHILEHLRQFPGKPIAVTKSNSVVRGTDGLVTLCRFEAANFRPACLQIDLSKERGQLEWAGLAFQWRVSARAGTIRHKKVTPGTELFDADAVGTYIILRHWRAGDRFQPIGMRQAVKLQDLFVNHKVPRQKRHELAVATTAAGELFWVEGLRMSERFKLTKATIRRLHWAWQRL